jgi:LPS sulfotransferase NodH
MNRHDETTTITRFQSGTKEALDWLETISPPSPRRQVVQVLPNWKPLYIFAMTARSGSTMLCSAMKSIPELGEPDEYLNDRGPFQAFHRRFGGDSLKGYFQAIISKASAANTFGIKTAYTDFRFLAESNEALDLLNCANFIYLTRRDIFAQATSLWAARKTSVWHASDGTKSSIAFNDYDFNDLVRWIKAILRERVSWESFFSLYGIAPLRLAYEDICGPHIAKSVEMVARQVGFQLDPSATANLVPRTTKLATIEQEQIITALKKDFKDSKAWRQLLAA